MPGQSAPPKSSEVVKDMLPGHAAFLELISGGSANSPSARIPEKNNDTA